MGFIGKNLYKQQYHSNQRRPNFDIHPRTTEAEAKAIMGMIERNFADPNLDDSSRATLTKQYNAAEERLYELEEIREAIASAKNIALDCKVDILISGRVVYPPVDTIEQRVYSLLTKKRDIIDALWS